MEEDLPASDILQGLGLALVIALAGIAVAVASGTAYAYLNPEAVVAKKPDFCERNTMVAVAALNGWVIEDADHKVACRRVK